MRRKSAAVIIASLLVAGCVGKLQTRPNREFTAPQGALTGLSYALPKVRYAVTLTRTLAECPDDVVNGKPTALKFKIAATATPTFLTGESYTIDYAKLPGWLRTTSFELKLYPNGTLKSLGASGEDKTAEVIDSVAKTALSLAKIVGLSSGGQTKAAAPDKIVQCTAAAKAQIAAARQAEADLKKDTALLEGYEKASERFKAAGAARLMDQAGRAAFLKLFDDIRTVEDDIARLKKLQSDLADELGVSDDIVWDGSVANPSYNKEYPLSAAQRAKLGALLTINTTPTPYPDDAAEAKRQSLMTACYGSGQANIDNCLNQQLKLRSGLYLDRSVPTCGTEGADPVECGREIPAGDPRFVAARDANPDSGIFVREPITGRLLFCRETLIAGNAPVIAPVGNGQPAGNGSQPPGTTGSNGNGANGTAGGTLEGSGTNAGGRAAAADVAAAPAPASPQCMVGQDEAKVAAGDFPQFGQLRFLPFRVGTFQAREMSISLTEAGRIDTFSYKSTKASAQALASTAQGLAAQYDDYQTKRAADRRTDAKNARDDEIAALDQQINVLTKQAQLKKLQTPPDVDPLQPTRDETAALDAELALLHAKLDRLKTEAALAEFE